MAKNRAKKTVWKNFKVDLSKVKLDLSYMAQDFLFESGKFTIHAPVGDDGTDATVRNNPRDVYAVQTALAELDRHLPKQVHTVNGATTSLSVYPGSASGSVTARTLLAIKNLQQWFLPRSVKPNGVLAPMHGQHLTVHRLGADRYGASHPSQYAFECMRHILQVTSVIKTGGLPPVQPGADAFVRLLQSKMGQPYIFGARVPKDIREWLGPWDCAEFIAWGLFQSLGNRFWHLLPHRVMLGTTYNSKTYSNFSKAENNVRFRDALAAQIATHLRRLQSNPAIVSRVRDAEMISRTPGLIGVDWSGRHVLATAGNGRTIEAVNPPHGNAVSSRSIDAKVIKRYRFWMIRDLYRNQPVRP
ncbi:MAG: hypothetical protein AAF666_20560 [Pseudomonadota bacterium]